MPEAARPRSVESMLEMSLACRLTSSPRRRGFAAKALCACGVLRTDNWEGDAGRVRRQSEGWEGGKLGFDLGNGIGNASRIAEGWVGDPLHSERGEHNLRAWGCPGHQGCQHAVLGVA